MVQRAATLAAAVTGAGTDDASAARASSERPQNQSIVLLGESGSCKTETAKLLIAYLRRRSTIVAPRPEDYLAAAGDEISSHGASSHQSGASKKSQKSCSGDLLSFSASSSSESESESEDSDGPSQGHDETQRRRMRTKKAVDRASEHRTRKSSHNTSIFGLKDLVLLFECFTHAATPQNPNSSRCGRFIKVHYATREPLPALATATAGHNLGNFEHVGNNDDGYDEDHGGGGDSSTPTTSGRNEIEWLRVGASIDLFGLDLSRVTGNASSIRSSGPSSNQGISSSIVEGGSSGDGDGINKFELPHRSFHALHALLRGAPPTLRQQLQLPDLLASSSTGSGAVSSSSKSAKGSKSSSRKSGISEHDSQLAILSAQEKGFQLVNRSLDRLSHSNSLSSSGGGGAYSDGEKDIDEETVNGVATTTMSSTSRVISDKAEHASSIAWYVVAAVLHLEHIQIGEVDSEAGCIAKLHPHLKEEPSNDNKSNVVNDDDDDGFGEEIKDESDSSNDTSDRNGSGDDGAFSMPAALASSQQNRAQEKESSSQSKVSLEAAAAVLGVPPNKLSQLLTEKRMGLSSGDAFTVIKQSTFFSIRDP